ncbi:MAG: imidazole glycerol phosphate synthase subunit HisH [Methylococcaceae bacterium]|nr:imidazole glycerol phosphate synthase subunit HisH [Methylococcaceae bacterium]
MSSVAVIDYGMGNLHSIAKALQHAASHCRVTVTDDPATIMAAERVVFPGVGSIGDCMDALKLRGLVPVLAEVVRSRPLLGICLGMQALLDDSEENGMTACLGIVPGHVRRFSAPLSDPRGNLLKIPHMGWNQVIQSRPHPLWAGIPDRSRFYFVHSYYACPNRVGDVAATTSYPEPFAAAIASGNLFAVQFHPEKSQAAGLRLLANFLDWNPKD